VVLPFTLALFLLDFYVVSPTKWLMFVIIFIQPFLVYFLASYRQYHNHDGRLMQKMILRNQNKIFYSKYKNTKTLRKIRNERYAIESVYPEKNQMGAFRVIFFNNIIGKVRPEIYLNGHMLTLKIINGIQVTCYAGKIIDSSMEDLTFKSGESEFTLCNPYYLSTDLLDDYVSSSIVWQCEGCQSEKNIYIHSKYFPYCDANTLYTFNFIVKGEILGTYSGYYIKEYKSIVVNIAGINKNQCKSEDPILKPVFDIKRKILLPKPVVVSQNNVLVKKYIFN
jgi:hypothetical protein